MSISEFTGGASAVVHAWASSLDDAETTTRNVERDSALSAQDPNAELDWNVSYYPLVQGVLGELLGVDFGFPDPGYATDPSGVDWKVEGEFTRAVRSLQPHLHNLRAGFGGNSRTSNVDPHYANEKAKTYLLASVPGFIVQSKMALKFAGVDRMQPPPKRVGLFCCGPCPEAVALAEFLETSQPLTETHAARAEERPRLQLDLFDLCNDEWRPVREQLLKAAFVRLEHLGYEPPEVRVHDFDLLQPATISQYTEIIRALDLAMFQNFDNETGSNAAIANQTVVSIARLLPPESKLLLSDLHYADDNHRTLSDLLSGLGRVERRDSGYRGVYHPPPGDFLKQNFFFRTERGQKTSPRSGHRARFLVLDRNDSRSGR